MSCTIVTNHTFIDGSSGIHFLKDLSNLFQIFGGNSLFQGFKTRTYTHLLSKSILVHLRLTMDFITSFSSPCITSWS
ncbi:hypothetical protein [Streptococcus pneumoniae]|uniref:hypothetical protein n=1 Tax=Streptococcus pneumoniae TaxID=1313 RepID=UPI003D7C1EDE